MWQKRTNYLQDHEGRTGQKTYRNMRAEEDRKVTRTCGQHMTVKLQEHVGRRRQTSYWNRWAEKNIKVTRWTYFDVITLNT